MTGARRPLVWLQACEREMLAPLRVLASQLAEFRNAPEVHVARPEDLPDPSALPPAAVIALAGDILPADLIAAARTRGTGLFWVEAGATPRLDRRSLFPGGLRRCLQRFDAIHCRDDGALAVIGRMLRGATTVVQIGGVLARHPPAQPCNVLDLDALRNAVGGRPVWFAYSLPASEFDAALNAQVFALRRANRLLMIAAPRDLRTGPDLAAQTAALGLQAARRLDEDEIDEAVQVYIADAEDSPGLFLRLAQVTFLGGSLTPGAGTPPAVEAASLGTALIFGPERPSDFLTALQRAGGGHGILRPTELGTALEALLQPEAGAAAALQAWTLASQGSEATWALARAICDWIVLNAPADPAGGAT